MPKKIIVKGARVHNLKNINIEIERNKLHVITGVSGSGKSSLAFDTLFAEGQRRYVESLSSYARQFLGKIQKPDVDLIQGIPPSIAIEQKVNTKNPRSTVGTSTEIYDYLKLLFARIGKTYSPVSGHIVKSHDVKDVSDFITGFPEGQKIMIASPIYFAKKSEIVERLELLKSQGFSRIISETEVYNIDQILDDFDVLKKIQKQAVSLLIDRVKSAQNESFKNRIADSIQTAFFEGEGVCEVYSETDGKWLVSSFSNRFEADGIRFEQPDVNLFTFNSPLGACPRCEGFGKTIGIDEDLVIPNKNLSVYQEAIMPWRGEKLGQWKDELIRNASKFDFPIHKPIFQLNTSQMELLWNGNQYFSGLNAFFYMLEKESYKIQNRVILSKYRGKTTCPECKGKRLRKEAQYVKIQNQSIADLVDLSIWDLKKFFDLLILDAHDEAVAKRILVEINSRIDFLINVGLGYLTLNRLSSSLSGGESQRINLATSLGSSLVGSLYILDEPSIGLHSYDTEKLIKVLRELQQLGNTVLVVEHDEDIMRQADEVIDIGPFAGTGGGELVFQGDIKALLDSDTLTSQYLNGKAKIDVPTKRRHWHSYLEIVGARENNLKNIDVKLPLEILTVITGVSGSGKSSLVKKILFPAMQKIMGGYGGKTGKFDVLKGDYNQIEMIEYVDQNPIGKSSRSNPVTYIKAYDDIRKLFADQQLAKQNGLKSGHFSFNVDGGRCDECLGEGQIKVEMQFMADVYLTCESCKGKRFKQEVLEVKYKGKSIHDVLEMTIDESIDFFSQHKGSTEKKILDKLLLLSSVGLGYVHLGQSSNTLSGGESQRIKLASYLAKEKSTKNLFIFDEPTTGLHFNDIKKLLKAINELIDRGHSVIIIEHNMEVIKSADWIIDLGPEGGENGGYIVAEGKPEDIVNVSKSRTAYYLKEKLN
ncbi:MAG: excinuclease ABC subunit UvrA [Bacteroidales bacterium]|nr:excinuclease ABC subunit UvrA [Bacteroidales bacterium]